MQKFVSRPTTRCFSNCSEGGLLRSNRSGINLVALDLDAWLVEGQVDKAIEQLEQTVTDLLGVLRSSGSEGAAGAVMLFPLATVSASSQECVGALEGARSRIREECASVTGWSVLDLSEASRLYSVSEERDPFTDELGNIPFTEACMWLQPLQPRGGFAACAQNREK